MDGKRGDEIWIREVCKWLCVFVCERGEGKRV